MNPRTRGTARVVAGLLVVAVSCAASARAEDAPAVFARLKTALAGSWKLEAPKDARGEAFRISFGEISRGSALVETFGDPAGSVTQTVYHLDGAHLVATHYCAQGNQPRLRLSSDDPKAGTTFTLHDVTNLREPKASHLVRMRIRLDGDRLEKEDVYRADGQEDATTLTLVRAR
jgi:hypothetical protein